jgi:hypothetical protein
LFTNPKTEKKRNFVEKVQIFVAKKYETDAPRKIHCRNPKERKKEEKK